MDPNAASAPSLISSLEAMIQASVISVLDRRLGPATDTLDVQIQAAVAAALDRRLGPAVGCLGNRMTSLVEQRLGNAVSTLDHRVNTSVIAALEQRLGPAGSALTAQITFPGIPFSITPSVPVAEAQKLGEANGREGNNGAFPIEEELANAQPMEDVGCIEKEPAKKQSAIEPEVSETTSPILSGESHPITTAGKSDDPTSKETDAAHSGVCNKVVYPLFTDSASKSKASTSAVLKSKPNATTNGLSSNADKTPAKRTANEINDSNKADDADESESSSEEESDEQRPKRKRPKVKLDPPGYTNGSPIKFRRVHPKLTACAKSRGYPRVIDLRGFTEASNKQNLTMADLVATFLFNYDPLSLYAFLDMDNYPTFRLIRKESDRKAKDLVVERRRESYGVVVKCGYRLSQIDRAKYRSDANRIWETKYEYIILPVGRWVPSNYMQDPVISNNSKRTIEQWATEFGTSVFLGKLWVEGSEAKIESDKMVP